MLAYRNQMSGGITMQIFQFVNEQAKRFAKTVARSGLLILVASLVAGAASAATLTTDKADYVPGQHVIFTGTGWQPGETVTIEIYETTVDPVFDEGGVTATADANGNISNGEFLV